MLIVIVVYYKVYVYLQQKKNIWESRTKVNNDT